MMLKHVLEHTSSEPSLLHLWNFDNSRQLILVIIIIIIIFFNDKLSNATHYTNENHVQI